MSCGWRLEIKQTAEGTLEVPGLVEARVYGTDDVWELLKSGSRVRSVDSLIEFKHMIVLTNETQTMLSFPKIFKFNVFEFN